MEPLGKSACHPSAVRQSQLPVVLSSCEAYEVSALGLEKPGKATCEGRSLGTLQGFSDARRRCPPSESHFSGTKDSQNCACGQVSTQRPHSRAASDRHMRAWGKNGSQAPGHVNY